MAAAPILGAYSPVSTVPALAGRNLMGYKQGEPRASHIRGVPLALGSLACLRLPWPASVAMNCSPFLNGHYPLFHFGLRPDSVNTFK
jgi:hypothetical protein